MDADNIHFGQAKEATEQMVNTCALGQCNKAWSDLPVIMKLNGNPNFDYKTQHFIQEQTNGNYTVIKHVYLTKQRPTKTKLESFAVGKLYEIAWGHSNNVVERKALLWMLEQTGGLQFTHFSLSTEKTRPISSSAMGTTSAEDDQDTGWDFILERFAPTLQERFVDTLQDGFLHRNSITSLLLI